VESAEIAAALGVMGCTAAQGWYFSKPLSPASATAWLIEHGVASGPSAALPPAHSAVSRSAGSPVISRTSLSEARPAPPGARPGLPAAGRLY